MTSVHVSIDRNSCCLNYSPHNKDPCFCLQYISGDVEDNGRGASSEFIVGEEEV